MTSCISVSTWPNDLRIKLTIINRQLAWYTFLEQSFYYKLFLCWPWWISWRKIDRSKVQRLKLIGRPSKTLLSSVSNILKLPSQMSQTRSTKQDIATMTTGCSFETDIFHLLIRKLRRHLTMPQKRQGANTTQNLNPICTKLSGLDFIATGVPYRLTSLSAA